MISVTTVQEILFLAIFSHIFLFPFFASIYVIALPSFDDQGNVNIYSMVFQKQSTEKEKVVSLFLACRHII